MLPHQIAYLEAQRLATRLGIDYGRVYEDGSPQFQPDISIRCKTLRFYAKKNHYFMAPDIYVEAKTATQAINEVAKRMGEAL
ncbi:hypothetical protein [Brevibacillus reuszeri]|uniref:hypothetical protein n=1 Tax=Brevibacillus reuszeri TaxID=54915 RepID=UPI000CCC4F61|nr:hypothetical protein [Brevibacillus reuszeri]